jgi:hypothetical protein
MWAMTFGSAFETMALELLGTFAWWWMGNLLASTRW